MLILTQLNQKELVQARTIWKKWREVVDAHFEFTVIVHDGKTDLERVYELRIRDCLITRLLRDKDIFQHPNLLRRIRFWGPVNVNCFQRIMDSATAVEELSLTKFALMQEELVGDTVLNGFSKIKKLELLGYMCKDESKSVAKNSSRIFSYNMPDLEKLTINFHCDISSINTIAVAFMDFVSRHVRLQNLQVSLVPEANHPNESAASRTTTVVISSDVQDLLQQVQLNMLRITTATKDLPIWTALLNSQTHLQDFRMQLTEGGLLTVHTAYVFGIPFDLVSGPLLRNAPTLTSVELKEIRLTPGQAHADATPLDASVFRYATNLKRLILYRNVDDYRRFPQYPDQPNITNLKMLPTTIEVLEISRFYCRSDELQFVVDVLEGLKNIVLLHTGSLNRLGVHGGIVESISKKFMVQTMNLTPLNYHCSIENKKYDVVKAKFGMNEGDHLYYDYERFRKGLPQPRPPSEAHSSTRSTQPSGDSHSCFGRLLRHRHHRYRPIRNRADLNNWEGCFNYRLARCQQHRIPAAAVIGAREMGICDRVLPWHGNIIQDLPVNENLSKLFFSLDLHIAEQQRVIAEPYLDTGGEDSISRVRRQRRWSGSSIGTREAVEGTWTMTTSSLRYF